MTRGFVIECKVDVQYMNAFLITDFELKFSQISNNFNILIPFYYIMKVLEKIESVCISFEFNKYIILIESKEFYI